VEGCYQSIKPPRRQHCCQYLPCIEVVVHSPFVKPLRCGSRPTIRVDLFTRYVPIEIGVDFLAELEANARNVATAEELERLHVSICLVFALKLLFALSLLLVLGMSVVLSGYVALMLRFVFGLTLTSCSLCTVSTMVLTTRRRPVLR
jgi:hypothetical protein